MHKTLHQWIQRHGLSSSQAQALWRLSGLQSPSSGVHKRLQQALGLVAALLLGAGLIFWVAANWNEQSRMFKLHLLQAAVAAPLLCAVFVPDKLRNARVALALLGVLALGGLLAYIGIAYQTGADAWQLFATWAALALPVVLVLRSDWLWALWLMIVSVSIGAWSGRSFNVFLNAFSEGKGIDFFVSILWLLVFVAPLAIEKAQLSLDAQSHARRPIISLRLAAVLAVSAWVTYALLHLFGGRYDESGLEKWLPMGFVYYSAFVLFAAWVGWKSVLRDLVVLSVAMLALDVLLLVLLAKWMFANANVGLEGLLFFAILAAVVVGASATWLFKQQKMQRVNHSGQS